MIDPAAVGKQWEKYAKWGVLAAVCAITYPIAFAALEGLVAWVAFAIVAYVGWSFAPVFATWIGNKKMQALIAVIEANPIETMNNLYAVKHTELTQAEDSIRDFDTELGNFKTQVKEVEQEYPEDVASYKEIQARMQDALKSMRDEQTFASEQLADFKAKIKKATVLFNMAKAANKMLEKSKSAQAQVFDEIKEAVSYRKVTNDLNRAFANLNSAVERRKTASILNSNKADRTLQLPEQAASVKVVDLGNVPSRQKTGIER